MELFLWFYADPEYTGGTPGRKGSHPFQGEFKGMEYDFLQSFFDITKFAAFYIADEF